MNKFLYINSKIAKRLIKIAEDIVSFEMTDREWKTYSEKHPGAKKENHHIIHVPGKSFRGSDSPEYLKREANAKMKYFQKMKQKHPNYKPIISKENLISTLKNGEYSCISAGVNKEDPKDVQKARQNPNFIKERTTALMNDLDKLGVEYTEIVGDYDGEEPSFLMPAGAKFTVIFLVGIALPLFFIAEIMSESLPTPDGSIIILSGLYCV